jgi:hypothetical protein
MFIEGTFCLAFSSADLPLEHRDTGKRNFAMMAKTPDLPIETALQKPTSLAATG